MTFTNLGIPVTSSVLWTTALSPNAAGDGWNYIGGSWIGPNPMEWAVVKNLTATATTTIYNTPNHNYPNTNFKYTNQLRALNGRIFFPSFANYTSYYDPTTETVAQLGPIVESPPIDLNASTTSFSASFDTAGLLYMATQESHYRPSMVSVTDPDTLVQTVLGYVGSGALSYTTYGYHIAPDTITAIKYVYVVYGENPWQLWALNVTTGVATKLYEVTSAGNISFTNISDQGWIAVIHSDLGKPDDVVTKLWCLDGATYPYTQGVAPPNNLARNVTPASNPLVNPPSLDISFGSGIVGWRAFGSSGEYAYITYTLQYNSPITIESLTESPDGVVGNAQTYQGFFRYYADNTHQWFGPEQTNLDIAQPLGIYISSLATMYWVGYPDGTFIEYDPSSGWQIYPTMINPIRPGYFGPSGNQLAGIKFAGNIASPTAVNALGSLAWSPSAGAAGRLYCAGTRDRTGTGAGIGYWDKQLNKISGTYASPLDTVQPQGLVALDAIGKIALSTNTLSGGGDAPLYVFDTALNLIATQTPIVGISNLGPIFPTADNNTICGGYINSKGTLSLYRWNVTTNALGLTQDTEFAGPIYCSTIYSSDNSAWLVVGNTLIGVNVTTLETKTVDISSIAPVSCVALHSGTIYLSSGATLYSTAVPATPFTVGLIDPEILRPSGVIGRAVLPGEFFDILISTLNSMCSLLALTQLDDNILYPTADVGHAVGVPDFHDTVILTINAIASALAQPGIDVNILTPAAETGEAEDYLAFYDSVIAKLNALINHL